MSVQLGDEVPDFSAESTQGTINFHDWIGDGWAVLFSHPKDFTPVCTTELGSVAGLQPEFQKRNCKIVGLSVDSVGDHTEWCKDIEEVTGNSVGYPLIGDTDLSVAKLFGMLRSDAAGSAGERTAGDNATVRKLFVIGPDKRVKLTLTYPMTTGRNFHEVLRVLDSIQLTATQKVATPANWKQGEDVIIVPSVSNEEAEKKYPQGWSSPKPYLRIVSQPD
jgi:alkyl hydroperoxide reductase subunit AhpC